MSRKMWICRNRNLIAAAATGLLLASCGGGPIDDDGEVITSEAGGDSVSIAISDDDALGSINMPRPNWLPADFPLPNDARIFITVAKQEQTPKIYMLQAYSRQDGEQIADRVVAWGKARGLTAERLEAGANNIHLASLEKGNGLDNANLQVHDKEDGVRQIVFAVSGDLLQ
ncbi:MAG: hypothetical protein R3E18_06810 [Sphingomonadaceae bacterium]|nr:hypothetical protein [Sphingomonadaceae bacterium]